MRLAIVFQYMYALVAAGHQVQVAVIVYVQPKQLCGTAVGRQWQLNGRQEAALFIVQIQTMQIDDVVATVFLSGGDCQIRKAVAIGVAPGGAAVLRINVLQPQAALLQYIDLGTEAGVGGAVALHTEVNIGQRSAVFLEAAVFLRQAPDYLQTAELAQGLRFCNVRHLKDKTGEPALRHA